MPGLSRGADVAALVFLLAILYVLVRPNSKAAEFVRLFSNALAAMVRTVTDL